MEEAESKEEEEEQVEVGESKEVEEEGDERRQTCTGHRQFEWQQEDQSNLDSGWFLGMGSGCNR